MSRGRIGITTTVPVEAIFAAGYEPVDLNNVFITDQRSYSLVRQAESVGLPRNSCSWIKGIHSVATRGNRLKAVVGVTQGDCSNTQALLEVLHSAGVHVIGFAYPTDGDRVALKRELDKFLRALGTSWPDATEVKRTLDSVRQAAHEIDRMTVTGLFSGEENHLALVNCSDFKGDYEAFKRELDLLIKSRRQRGRPSRADVRLGFVGVPPVFSDLYSTVESMGADIVYNEVQHQFSMPEATSDLTEQYAVYTYPYGIARRLGPVRREANARRLDGIIHYVQSFCFHHIEDVVVRRTLKDMPVLTLEGDKPGPLDGRSRLRVEAFIETLREGRHNV